MTVLLAPAAVAAGATGAVSRADAAIRFRPFVSVDFARPEPARPLVGFLHGLDERTPDDALIVPLHPADWRGSLYSAPYDRVRSLGARYTLVVSDLWGYPGAGWYGRSAPWEDWGAWTDFVRRLARENRGRDLVWDVWNEPDVPYFWTGSQAQYLEAYRRAEAAIRGELGTAATIAGPSTAGFSWRWLVALLEFCRQADCRVDALTWHELPYGHAITRIGAHLRRVRAGILSNPGYAVLGLRELDVGEIVGAGDTLHPGELLGYLAQLEHGGVRSAMHACWPESRGFDTCNEHTLDGLLDRQQRRRAPWWALAWYARGARSRAAARSADPAVAVLASRAPSPGAAEVLVGYLDTHDRALPRETGVGIELRGLRRLGFLRGGAVPRVRAWSLTGRGEEPATPVRIPAPGVVEAAPNRIVLLVGRLALHDALLVRLSAPARRALVRASPPTAAVT
ncbi:MAG TPA: hypothetical protein VLB47_12195, partial [Solirubrobacteraceae bacterium]|nr:hypothetical protein [Solirubrobacteraceae bacterium]